MNYNANLTLNSNFFQKNISSRLLSIVSIPLELIASLENLIKLPYHTVTLSLKIPATILNMLVRSKSLREFESQLASPLKVIQTATKIMGYVLGTLSTATLGLISPNKNFKLHCFFGLINDKIAEKAKQLEEEKKQREIDAYEKVLSTRLNAIIEAMRYKASPQPLIPRQLHEIETLVPIPPMQDTVQNSQDTVQNSIDLPEKQKVISEAPITFEAPLEDNILDLPTPHLEILPDEHD